MDKKFHIIYIMIITGLIFIMSLMVFTITNMYNKPSETFIQWESILRKKEEYIRMNKMTMENFQTDVRNYASETLERRKLLEFQERCMELQKGAIADYLNSKGYFEDPSKFPYADRTIIKMLGLKKYVEIEP